MTALWERQPWDTAASFRAFSAFYLPQDPGGRGRSLDAAYRAYLVARARDQSHTGHIPDTQRARIQAKRAPSTWRGWYRAQDAGGAPIPGALGWQARAAAWDNYQHQQRLAELQRQRRAAQQRHIETGQAMQQLAWEKLQEMVEAAARGVLDLDIAEARRLALAGIEVERQALDLPTDVLKIMGMSDDELLARYSDLVTRVRGSREEAAER